MKITKEKQTWGRTEPMPWPVQTAVWKTKEGEEICVCDMTDTHLVNTLRMIKRDAIKRLAETKKIGYAYGRRKKWKLKENDLKKLTWRKLAGDIFGYMDVEAERRGIDWEKMHILDK